VVIPFVFHLTFSNKSDLATMRLLFGRLGAVLFLTIVFFITLFDRREIAPKLLLLQAYQIEYYLMFNYQTC